MGIELRTFEADKLAQTKQSRKLDFNFGKKFSEKKKEALYKELAMLLNAGVDFKKSLEILSEQASSQQERDVINGIKEQVVEGKGIYETMEMSGHFSPYEYFSVQIGEETGKLEVVLSELQKFFARKIQMKRQIVSVVTYPVIVLTVTLLVLYFMLNKVVPMFSAVFKQFGSQLPLLTRCIIKLSGYSGTLFVVFFIFVAGVFIFHRLNAGKVYYRKATSYVVLKLPFFGKLIRKIYLSRFCQAMGLLTSSHTSLISSLSLTSKMIGFYPLESSIEKIKHDVIKGMSLSQSLKNHSIYDQKMVSMISVAEEVNQLDTMFERLAEQYNEEINHESKLIGVILEPMIIIIIGAIVGVIMVAMYAPMFDLSKIIKN